MLPRIPNQGDKDPEDFDPWMDDDAMWLKALSWNFPPYKSEGFMEIVESFYGTLDDFKETGVYKNAVEYGLIVNDEWNGSEEGYEPIPVPEEGERIDDPDEWWATTLEADRRALEVIKAQDNNKLKSL